MTVNRIFGTPVDDVLPGADYNDTLFSGAGNDLITQEGTGAETWHAFIDGGAGEDTVSVILPDGTPLDGNPYYAYAEVDPILNAGYTHRLAHIRYQAVNDALLNDGTALLRNIEVLNLPDGDTAALDQEALIWHAETLVQSDDTQVSFGLYAGNSRGRTVASLNNDTVVQVFQTADAGADYGRLAVRIFDSDGTLLQTTGFFGQGTYQLFNPYEFQSTNGAQVVALQDGGFAVAWYELSSDDANDRNASEGRILVQLFDADGAASGAIVQAYVKPAYGSGGLPISYTFDQLSSGDFVLSYQAAGTSISQRILTTEGAVLDAITHEPGFFPQHQGVVAVDGGYVSFFEDTTLRDRDNASLNRIMAREYAVNEDTGEIAFVQEVVLHQLEPDVHIIYIDYVALGDGSYAALYSIYGDDNVYLTSYVDGVINTVQANPEGTGVHSNRISLIEGPDGGAYMTFGLYAEHAGGDPLYGAFVYAAHITAGGQIEPGANMSDDLDRHSGLDAVTTATSDGVISIWQQNGITEWVSYQAADGYNAIQGTTGDDTLTGTAGDDLFQGGDGNDLLQQSGGADRFDGGDGNDTFSVAGQAGDWILSLDEGYVTTPGTPLREALIGLENLIGSDGNDTLVGDGGANLLDAGAGDDVISGSGGADTIRGGAGTDIYLVQSGGLDQLLLDAAASVEVLDLASGPLEGTRDAGVFDLSGVISYGTFDAIELNYYSDDRFIGTQAGDSVLGDGGDDWLDGYLGNDTLNGESGNDTLIGGAGDDLLTGGHSFSTGNAFVFAPGFGNDTITDFQAYSDRLEFQGFTQDQLDQITVEQVGTDRIATFHDGSTMTLLGVPRNYAVRNSPEVSGDAIEDAVLTADLSRIADWDGFDPNRITVQWTRDGLPIAGATGLTYTLAQADVGAEIHIVATYTDLFRTEETVSRRAASNVQNVNDAPEGILNISGLAEEGAVLTVSDGITDEDGIRTDSVAYQWFRDGVQILGAEATTYTLMQADVGAVITVAMSYQDMFYNSHTLDSEATETIQNVNDPVQGSVLLSASQATVGDTLFADASAISDADGLGVFSYQWLRDGATIPDAVDAEYTISAADTGHEISVRVSFNDGQGTAESVTSATLVSENLTIDETGTNGNDLLRGAAGPDTLSGGDGADTLIGGDGDDRLIGGATEADLRDVVYGGDGNDWIDGGYGNDELRGDTGDDTISGGFGTDTVIGADGNDVLTGEAWSDILYGGAGNDFINGGFGYDRMNGGSGADRFFHLGVADHGSDWIQEYNAAEGDVLVFGRAGTRDQFQVNFTETANAGESGIEEAFVVYRPTGQILWALVDGGGQAEINLQLAGVVYDLLH